MCSALNVRDAVKLAAVFVPKWQVQEQIHACPNAQLRNKGVGPFGPDAFEKFYRRMEAPRPWSRQATSLPRQTNIKTGFSKFCLTSFKKAAPVAPSTTRWSQLRVTFMVWPGTTAPSRTTGTA